MQSRDAQEVVSRRQPPEGLEIIANTPEDEESESTRIERDPEMGKVSSETGKVWEKEVRRKLKGYVPSNKDEVPRWKLIHKNLLYQGETIRPSSGIVGDMKVELENIVKDSIELLKPRESRTLTLIQIINVYFRFVSTLGREYILDLEFQDKKGLFQRRISLLRPLQPKPTLISVHNDPAKKTVNFIIPLYRVSDRLSLFLDMYLDLCVHTQESCKLILVLFSDEDEQVVNKTIPNFKDSFDYDIIRGEGHFSRGTALHQGMLSLRGDDLAFMCDVDMTIEKAFLGRCRQNAIQSRRVYYPEVFKYYNMDYVYKFNRKPPESSAYSIHRLNGHWNTYGYGMLCIHKSDYDAVGGFNTAITGWGVEDVDLAERIVGAKLDIMRVPDPSLSHRFHDKVCDTNLTPKQFANCISSRNEDIADRTTLAEHVFYLEKQCGLHHRKLWVF